MTTHPDLALHRRPPLHPRPFLAICLTWILVQAGCATMQLNTFQKHAAQGDDAWIAAQEIDCDNASAVCGQLHLLKGHACFRLANAGTAPADNYSCAADELAQGLALTPSWKDPAEHRRFQEDLCESLSNLQNLQSGAAAEKTLVRFIDAAQGLYGLAPGSVPAIYYLALARLRQAQPLLVDMSAADRLPVCNRLKRTLNGVLSMMQTARKSSLPDWERFAAGYQRLSFDLGLAVRAAECR